MSWHRRSSDTGSRRQHSGAFVRLKVPTDAARLLKESGRDTSLPIFVIGAFSGTRKLGEGFGPSLDMARFRAAEDALRRIYLSRSIADAAATASGAPASTPDLPSLPSDTLADPSGPPYRPRPLGDEEVVAGSSGRSGWTARQTKASPFRTDEAPMWKRPARAGPRPQAAVRSRS